LVLTVR